MEKKRITHSNSTICYLKKNNSILMLKFNKKWGQLYAPPGGKFESNETPLECIIREFKEETGLILIDPKLQGLAYWYNENNGIIFVFTAENFSGNLLSDSIEGELEWIDIADFDKIVQFEQNKVFESFLFTQKIFESKCHLDDTYTKVLKYDIKYL